MKKLLLFFLMISASVSFSQEQIQPEYILPMALNIGFSSGFGMNFVTENNQIGNQKAVSPALLTNSLNYFSINAQLGSELFKGFGYNFELGFQTLRTAYGHFEGTNWNGYRTEGYELPFAFAKPGLLKVMEVGEQFEFVPKLNLSFNLNTDPELKHQLYGVTYHSRRFFMTIDPSVEFRSNLDGAFYIGIFAEYRQGVSRVISTTVNTEEAKSVAFNTYNGNGFTIGARVSLCLPCK